MRCPGWSIKDPNSALDNCESNCLSRLVCARGCGRFFNCLWLTFKFAQALEDHKEHRHEKDCQGGGGHHAAGDRGAHGLLAGGAGAGGKHQRQDTKNE